MPSTWSECWKSSELITTTIAFTSRFEGALGENELANRRPPTPSLPTRILPRSVSNADRGMITNSEIYPSVRLQMKKDRQVALATPLYL
jgi:hypothetical protein